jgi:3-deoxy-manno-octulosonate cytidylyltransferase (CMP-KDO synthetase)
MEDFLNPNIVKVVADDAGMALYFSRAPIPWDRDGFAGGTAAAAVPAQARRHLGIYAYRVALLRQFVTWPPARLETTESLEQLRALANGARIHVADAVASVPPGVDTAADLEAVRAIVEGE